MGAGRGGGREGAAPLRPFWQSLSSSSSPSATGTIGGFFKSTIAFHHLLQGPPSAATTSKSGARARARARPVGRVQEMPRPRQRPPTRPRRTPPPSSGTLPRKGERGGTTHPAILAGAAILALVRTSATSPAAVGPGWHATTDPPTPSGPLDPPLQPVLTVQTSFISSLHTLALPCTRYNRGRTRGRAGRAAGWGRRSRCCCGGRA